MKRSLKNTLGGLALTVVAGLTFAPIGCGGSFKPPKQENADGEIPEEVARQIRTCAAKYMEDLPGKDQTISFEVKLAGDGGVDSISLRDSTVGHEPLQACMAKAIRQLSEDQLTLRGSRRHGELPRERGRFLGQEELAVGCLASPPCLLTVGFVIGATYLVVALYVSMRKPKPTDPTYTRPECTDLYVHCTDHTPTAPCGQCVRICAQTAHWPEDMCPL